MRNQDTARKINDESHSHAPDVTVAHWDGVVGQNNTHTHTNAHNSGGGSVTRANGSAAAMFGARDRRLANHASPRTAGKSKKYQKSIDAVAARARQTKGKRRANAAIPWFENAGKKIINSNSCFDNTLWSMPISKRRQNAFQIVFDRTKSSLFFILQN